MAIAVWFEQHKRQIQYQTTLYRQNWDVIKGAIQDQINSSMLSKVFSSKSNISNVGIGIIKTLFPNFRKYRDQKTAKTKSQ